jgi:uncharacterized membrane protein YfcA
LLPVKEKVVIKKKAMAGAGAGVAVIPILHMIGVDFNLAKAVGLFAGASTTITSSVMNLKRNVLDFKFVWPIALMMMIFAPLGAYCSKFLDDDIVKFLFMLLLFYSASMMLFGKKKQLMHATGTTTLFLVGIIIGFISGLLGVGGGNILIPFLVLLGFEPKKVAVAVSSVIPFSAFTSFLSYASFVQIDWSLLGASALGSIVGATVGNHMLHFKLSQKQIKKIIALILYMLAVKMIYSILIST